MKAIIQRALPLNTQYTLIDKAYIPLEDGCGLTCANCGALIARIATVKNEQLKVFDIGFDCLETILINNSLLSTGDIAEYEKIKKMIPQILRFSKQIQENLNLNNNTIEGLAFEKPTWGDWITYHLVSGRTTYNTNVKLKGMDFDFLIKTLKTIYPKLSITVNTFNEIRDFVTFKIPNL